MTRFPGIPATLAYLGKLALFLGLIWAGVVIAVIWFAAAI